MERVDGVSIDAFAEEQQLGISGASRSAAVRKAGVRTRSDLTNRACETEAFDRWKVVGLGLCDLGDEARDEPLDFSGWQVVASDGVRLT